MDLITNCLFPSLARGYRRVYNGPLLAELSQSMSSSAQALAPSLDLGNTYGALFIGVVIAAMLVNHLFPLY